MSISDRLNAADNDASAYTPTMACNGHHEWTGGKCVACHIAAPAPHRLAPARYGSGDRHGDVQLIPARVQVAGIDGTYSDPGILRESADILLRAADRLAALKGVRS